MPEPQREAADDADGGGAADGAPAIRVAAIDCGTNSIRLLIADVANNSAGDWMADNSAGDRLVDVVRELRIVRLGQGVDRTGRLDPAAIERTRVALAEYAGRIRESGAGRVRMVATSATRDAANRAEFATMVDETLGQPAEVITGAEEAALSFAGATEGLASTGAPYLVVDIGGGSTEFVLGDAAAHASRSVDIGCVRMTERHLTDDPPTRQQISAARADIRAGIDAAGEVVPIRSAATLIGVAGTVTTVAAIALGLPEYDAAAIHGSRISADQVRDTSARLLTMTHDERAALPVMHPGRVDVIGAGSLILAEIVDATGAGEVVVSEHDILDGIAMSMARR